jgi:hypothetical protein
MTVILKSASIRNEGNSGLTFKCRPCFLFISCIRRYISVLVGSGCSQSFLGTANESMVYSQYDVYLSEERRLNRLESPPIKFRN